MSAATLTGQNPYIGQTDREPRPTADSWFGPNLPERQQLWDAAAAHQAEDQRLRAARLADLEARQIATRDQAARDRDAAAERLAAAREIELQGRFLDGGGTVAQWRAERAAILAEDRRRRVFDADAPAYRGTL